MLKILKAGTYIALILLFNIFSLSSAKAIEKACENTNDNINYWRKVRKTADTVNANDYVISLASCLASPNPELRDKIGYEVLTYWLRNDKLEENQINELKQKLLTNLTKGSGVIEGEQAFERAFSALILSEIVRDDSRHERWSTDELNDVLSHARKMFEAERDYRGLDIKLGWIHTIAHGSDLLWRLSLHPKITKQQQIELLTSLKSQIARSNAPAYIFNEPDRLTRVAISIILSEKLDAEFVVEWIAGIGLPAPMPNWNAAFSTPDGMAKLHNTKQFLRALRQPLQANQEPEILNAIDSVLSKLP